MMHTMPHRFIVNDNSKFFTAGRDISVIHGAVKQKRIVYMERSFRVLRRNVEMKFIKSKLYLTPLLGRNENLL